MEWVASEKHNIPLKQRESSSGGRIWKGGFIMLNLCFLGYLE